MTSLLLYSYQTCQTCKKAQKFLESKKISFSIKKIVENPPTLEMLTAALKNHNGNIKKLFNTSGQAYRSMELAKKLPEMSDTDAIKLLSENGMLIKRPFLWISEGQNTCGFKVDVWTDLIDSAN